MLAAFDWSLAHPGPAASRPFDGIDGAFYQDLCNPAAAQSDAYDGVLRRTPIADLVTGLWGDPQIWFMYEQVFLKDGGENRRTPWHQDASYLNVDGDHLAVVWITLSPSTEGLLRVRRRVPPRDAVQQPRRSTRMTRRSRLLSGLPRLPDIEADRAAFDIVSWAIDPGDVVVSHPTMLHGGGPTRPGQRRSTLSLRFFGRDAVYAERPGGRVGHAVRAGSTIGSAPACRSVTRPSRTWPRPPCDRANHDGPDAVMRLLPGERGPADRRLGRRGIEAMPERVVLLMEVGDGGARSERIVRINRGSLSIRGDVRDEAVEVAEAAGGVVVCHSLTTLVTHGSCVATAWWVRWSTRRWIASASPSGRRPQFHMATRDPWLRICRSMSSMRLVRRSRCWLRT